MLIIPAIDIKNGKCVRLTQGDFEREKVYNEDPFAVAKSWEEQGAQMIHIVDLDGAKSGMQVNFAVIKKIVQAVAIPVQVGGGIRNKKRAEKLFSLGVARIVLGTVALENEDELQSIVKNFARQTVVALEVKDGVLLKNGWIEKSEKGLIETALGLQKLGVKKFLYTDVVRDGMLTEPNYSEIEILKEKIQVPVIVSGGIASLSAIKRLKGLAVEEAIIGKAFYENKFTLKEALDVS